MYIGEALIPMMSCLCKNWGILKQISTTVAIYLGSAYML